MLHHLRPISDEETILKAIDHGIGVISCKLKCPDYSKTKGAMKKLLISFFNVVVSHVADTLVRLLSTPFKDMVVPLSWQMTCRDPCTAEKSSCSVEN